MKHAIELELVIHLLPNSYWAGVVAQHESGAGNRNMIYNFMSSSVQF